MTEGRPLFARITIPLIILLLAAGVTWAYFTEVEEIARGEGKVIPATKMQIVQATEPGVVLEILTQVGQVVNKGDLIVRLDDTTTTSSLGENVARLRALTAKMARLGLEEAGKFDAEYQCPESIKVDGPDICENEARLFAARQENYRNTLSVLRQRKIQREKELDEVNANIDRLSGSVEISQRELELIRPMVERRLVAQTDLISAERSLNENKGQFQMAQESVQRLESSIDEAELQIIELGLQFKQEALSEKTQTLAELSVLRETVRGGTNRVERTDIRSPVDGIVNAMAVNTIGSFVQPGTTIAEVVPTSDELLVEARIKPSDIAFIRAGQEALVKVSAYDFSIYGGLEAGVATITADSIVDQKTGEAYFSVLVRTKRSYLEKNGKRHEITPGMLCTVDIITGNKTILQYLLKPITKARQEALTER